MKENIRIILVEIGVLVLEVSIFISFGGLIAGLIQTVFLGFFAIIIWILLTHSPIFLNIGKEIDFLEDWQNSITVFLMFFMVLLLMGVMTIIRSGVNL